MKNIIIEYSGESFEVSVTKIYAYPNNVYKIEYSNIRKLFLIIQSPVYIEVKDNIVSFQDVNNTEQIDLLKCFWQAIEDNYDSI